MKRVNVLKSYHMKTVSVLLVLFIVFTSSIESNAYGCSHCWSDSMLEVCSNDMRLIEYGYHQYGFLGNKSCYARYYDSRGGYVCPSCGAVEMWMDIDGGYARHLCFENHDSCSKGYYDVCPF